MMGSPKVLNSKPQLAMAEYTDKKSIKHLLKKPFQALFHKDKKKDKAKNEKETTTTQEKPKIIQPPPKVTPVTTLLENFKKLEIEKKEQKTTKKGEDENEEDELKNFTIKVVEDDRRSERIDSHSSQDSGFSEKEVVEAVDTEDEGNKHDKEEDVIETFNNLQINDDDDKKKKRRLQTVYLSRQPIRRKNDLSAATHPYAVGQQGAIDNNFRQINQVNKQTFSGGQVIVNANQTLNDNFFEIGRALTQTEINVQKFAQNSIQEQEYCLQLALEYITEESYQKNTPETPEDILSDFVEVQNLREEFDPVDNFACKEISEPNPIEEFTNTTHTNFENIDNLELYSISNYVPEETSAIADKTYIYPTPPRSENVPSPMSDSQASSVFYPSNSEYILSPERSSPIYNSDYEKYQDITQFDDQYPSCVTDMDNEKTIDKPKARERNASTSSMTMKQFKDMQKELSMKFSKKECCQTVRKTCKEIFQEHMQKLKMEERKNACLKVANMDLKSAYGVLRRILMSLSESSKDEDLQHVLFCLICERVLAQSPALFIGDFGLNLIKFAVLRCYRRPIFTRYLVQCVRTALRVDTAHPVGKDCVFQETDSLGDNLLIACARIGDTCADVLAELVRCDHDTDPGRGHDLDRGRDRLPLFNVHHTNAEGYSALHVSCSAHSAGAKATGKASDGGAKLHTTHVLLQHAGADLWKGDVKGGDTALHLAVNSATCDLGLVMVLFRHVDRKLWKQLAHAQNRSSVTPLEYARSATKSTTRQNYPHEVLDFLKKCR